ncbi:cell division protein FtsY [Stenotrophomonas sp. CC120222-04]|uniref:cell division protein FtsY n=1 Tax=unclassified Stenotrophomonas TaxID=196198 RepID=UPI000B75F02C|nr:cell division protein FtsY [Stenotrophomonas sp. CC120222-04]SNT81191.1 fused signal recognition particle receptor [Stenotrophomonas sp. CC120222-04]
MTTQAPLPPPSLPDTSDVAVLADYGAPLLQALTRRETPLLPGAGEGLVAALARIALALQAANPAQIRQQEGWWGRLLGRDVDREAEGRALQSQLGVLALQAREQALHLQQHLQRRAMAIAGHSAAAAALDDWVGLAAARLASLDIAGQAALSQRLDHLRRLASLRRLEAGQWQLLQDQDNVLLQRFARIHDVLLPAWRQAAVAGQAAAGATLAAKAAMLHAQIDDEVAAAQARLP